MNSTAHIVSKYDCLHVAVFEKCLNFVRQTLCQITALLAATHDGTQTCKYACPHIKDRKLAPKQCQECDMGSNCDVASF